MSYVFIVIFSLISLLSSKKNKIGLLLWKPFHNRSCCTVRYRSSNLLFLIFWNYDTCIAYRTVPYRLLSHRKKDALPHLKFHSYSSSKVPYCTVASYPIIRNRVDTVKIDMWYRYDIMWYYYSNGPLPCGKIY